MKYSTIYNNTLIDRSVGHKITPDLLTTHQRFLGLRKKI